MKRLILLGILAAALLGVAATASAADIKATGQWIVEAIWSDNFDLVNNKNDNSRSNLNNTEEKFNIWTRVRTQFEFIANENLKGVLATEVGSNKWGSSGTYDLGSTPTVIGVRRAYVDFNWPGTKVNFKAGPLIGVGLPAAVGGGSAIFDEEVSSLVVSAPITDNVSVLGVYARLFSGAGAYSANPTNTHDSMDAFALALPIKFDGFKVTPFGMFAYAENGIFNRSNTVTAHTMGLLAQNASTSMQQGIQSWWGGAAIEMTMFDPFVVKADVNYGSLTSKAAGNDSKKQNNMSGWMLDLSVDYTGLSFMTPQLFFAWSSGEDGNATTGSNSGAGHRMPMVVASSYSLGSFWMSGASGKALAGSTSVGTARSNLANSMGFWTVGLNLKDITFLEGLKHTFTVMYVQGTNSKDIGPVYNTSATDVNNIQYGQTLTTKDSLWEVDLNTSYAIYKELTAYLELGYIAPSFSKSVWGDSNGGDAATKIAVGLGYNF